MSLLTAVQDAMVQCGLDAPTTAYTNTGDETVQFFVRLAQVEGDALSRFASWRGLKTSGTLTGDGTTTQFALPAGFHRFMTAYPLWLDGTPSIALKRVSDDELLAMQVADVNPVRSVWRLKGEYIEFFPAPELGAVIKYEYLSQYWIAGKSRFTADADTIVIPERLVTLGMVWRFNAAKGFDYGEDFRTYQIERQKEHNADIGAQTLKSRTHFMSDYRVPALTDARVIP